MHTNTTQSASSHTDIDIGFTKKNGLNGVQPKRKKRHTQSNAGRSRTQYWFYNDIDDSSTQYIHTTPHHPTPAHTHTHTHTHTQEESQHHHHPPPPSPPLPPLPTRTPTLESEARYFLFWLGLRHVLVGRGWGVWRVCIRLCGVGWGGEGGGEGGWVGKEWTTFFLWIGKHKRI